MELVGQEALPGGPAHRLKVTLKTGAVRHVWVDAATGLVVRTASTRTLRGREVTLETTFGDYRETGGVDLRPLDRGRRAGPAAAAADRRRERGGEPRARRLPIPDAALMASAREGGVAR